MYDRLEAAFHRNETLLDWYAETTRKLFTQGKDIHGMIVQMNKIIADQKQIVAAMNQAGI